MKEYSCCNGHQFNQDEMEASNSHRICPFCWKNSCLYNNEEEIRLEEIHDD